MLRFNGTKVPPDYEARFQLALWAFRHARVYCTTEKVGPHTPKAARSTACVCYVTVVSAAEAATSNRYRPSQWTVLLRSLLLLLL